MDEAPVKKKSGNMTVLVHVFSCGSKLYSCKR